MSHNATKHKTTASSAPPALLIQDFRRRLLQLYQLKPEEKNKDGHDSEISEPVRMNWEHAKNGKNNNHPSVKTPKI